MRVVTSFVGSGPSHCVLVLGCAGDAADAPAGLLCPASLAGGSSAAGSRAPWSISTAHIVRYQCIYGEVVSLMDRSLPTVR